MSHTAKFLGETQTRRGRPSSSSLEKPASSTVVRTLLQPGHSLRIGCGGMCVRAQSTEWSGPGDVIVRIHRAGHSVACLKFQGCVAVCPVPTLRCWAIFVKASDDGLTSCLDSRHRDQHHHHHYHHQHDIGVNAAQQRRQGSPLWTMQACRISSACSATRATCVEIRPI